MNRKISIIIPAYNEQDSLAELYHQILLALDDIPQKSKNNETFDYELWFVNDGSTDNTEKIVESIMEHDDNVHLVSLRSNFGKSIALDTAFQHVTGDIIFTIDADLQDEPSEFSRFIEKIDAGFDLVVGWKRNRLDSAEKRIPSIIFNFVTSRLSGIKLHDIDCGFKCFRKDAIKSLRLYGDLHRFIPLLLQRNGFRITEIVVNHRRRQYGKSKYGIERYLRGLFDCFTVIFLLKYSFRPMYLFGLFGIIFITAGFIICLYLTWLWFNGVRIGDRPLLLLGILLLILGIQSISTGLIGNLIVDRSHNLQHDNSHIKIIK